MPKCHVVLKSLPKKRNYAELLETFTQYKFTESIWKSETQEGTSSPSSEIQSHKKAKVWLSTLWASQMVL